MTIQIEREPFPANKDGFKMLRWAVRNPPADPTQSFAGKTVLLTGATAGLGYEAALKFAALDASKLIFGVRSLTRGETTKRSICERTGYDPDNIHLYHLDMTTFDSVRAFASVITKQEPIVNIAVLNAGVSMPSYEQSPDGFETLLQVNVLSTALLGILLLPKLRASAHTANSPSHLEFVGSNGHRLVKPDQLPITIENATASVLTLVNDPSFFGPSQQYTVSKLLLMYAINGIISATSTPSNPDTPTNTTPNLNPNPNDDKDSDKTGNLPVIITTVCPGLCKGTSLGRSFPRLLHIPMAAAHYFTARTAEQGSRTLVSGTQLGPDAHGMFWHHDVFFEQGEMVTGEYGGRVGERFWRECRDVWRERGVDVDGVLGRG